ncbi:ABC-F family ATP-binding cassette domain-containing protein [Halodesulfovibrio marinisediminis]|uniref:ATP-binding cassette, subfamily F, member 3 n=1 Tax=Halodesulfovibrio marinisediminis DSM 17456 TaxID=1121457 RepID=A0A1N6J553_9BACT|nr:ABC-F family ATP-binding cassette domain-containing protein [Halodesulfovibrio marinisediminis]SIO39362.1 ATP-binding cassette, subfamily F, member 3 [Halodesulfovibrio marinisediminis DSM 17456]
MSITLDNISKFFGGDEIIPKFSLDIADGTRLCVCGPNGCGKSTLLKMVAGIMSVDSGRVLLPKGCRLGFVQQELDESLLGLPLLSWVLEVLPDWNNFWEEWEAASQAQDEAALKRLGLRQAELEQIYGHNPEHRAKTVLTGLGFSEDKWLKPMRELSGGWRERAKLARVLTAGADVLLLDEPTNHLDLDAVEWLENFLLDYQGVLIFVAHDRIFMDKVGSHVLFLGGNKPMFRKGNFSQFLVIQEEFEAQKEREAAKLQEDIARNMDFVRRFKAKATKARQAGSKQKMAQRLQKELDGIKFETKRKQLAFAWPEPAPAEKLILSVSDLRFTYPDGVTLWSDLEFQLYRGQKIALVGPNGCGKSTLLKLIAGRLEKNQGSIMMASKAKMGYFSQHQLDTLNAQNTVLSEIRRLSDPKTTEEELMSVLGLFMLGQSYFERVVGELSGGEKSRLMMAILFLSRCNFLVLDEPTNHLDLESREALVEALASFEGTILMVAHDRYLLKEVANQLWSLSPKGLMVHERGFEEYDKYRKEQNALASGKYKESSPSGGLSREEQKRLKREQAELRNRIYKELKPKQQTYEKMEEKLMLMLEEQGELETKMADPDFVSNSAEMQEALKRFGQLQNDSEALMEEMGELEIEINELEQQREALTS